jgi:hypothetical protein
MSEFGTAELTNAELREDLLPSPEASWHDIQRFALTFDAYGHWGSLQRCAEIANSRDHRNLTHLRTCLFFEQRRWRHFGEAPKGTDLRYMQDLVERIREKVQGQDID